MPKVRAADVIVSDNGVTKVVEITTAKGGEEKGTVTAQYAIPANGAAFQEMMMNLTDSPDGGEFVKSVFLRERGSQGESPLAFALRAWTYAIDKMVRADVYETIQAESTLISVGSGKPKFDLKTVPAGNLVIAVNGMRGKRASDLLMLSITDPDDPANEEEVKSVDRKLNYRQFQTAAAWLVDEGKARENAASGMLEFVG